MRHHWLMTAVLAAGFALTPACADRADEAGEDVTESDTLAHDGDLRSEVGEAVEETGEAIGKAVEETGEAIEGAGEAIQEGADQTH